MSKCEAVCPKCGDILDRIVKNIGGVKYNEYHCQTKQWQHSGEIEVSTDCLRNQLSAAVAAKQQAEALSALRRDKLAIRSSKLGEALKIIKTLKKELQQAERERDELRAKAQAVFDTIDAMVGGDPDRDATAIARYSEAMFNLKALLAQAESEGEE
jgi:predicted metal-dependent hydrolase